MAVNAAVKGRLPFYKHMIDAPEFIEREDGIYLDPIFYLAYFNILNIYRIIEPEHPMLKPVDDQKRYYSDTTKDEIGMFAEHVQNGSLNNIQVKSTRLNDENFAFFYEEIEVENTVLLQYLMVSFGKKSLANSYKLTSRRKRKYELTAVPVELRGIFDALGIYSTQRAMRPVSFSNVTNGDYRERFQKKTLDTNQIVLFHSIAINQRTFSLGKVLAQCMTRFIFYSKESVERHSILPTGILQITAVNGFPRPLTELPRFTGDAIEKPPSLNQLLNYIQARQSYFYKQYNEVGITQEVKSALNQRITNETKKEVARFFSGHHQFVQQISLSRPVRHENYPDYRVHTFQSVYKELQTGFYGQMFACLRINPELASGSFLSSEQLSCYSIIRTPGLMYKEVSEIIPPNQLMPLIAESAPEQTEQLSLLEEGALA